MCRSIAFEVRIAHLERLYSWCAEVTFSTHATRRTPTMTATEARIQELARQHLDLGRDLDLDTGLLSSDISSLDAVAFVKKVGVAFGVEIPPEEVANWKNMRNLAAFLDSGSG
ncbi:MAG: acyl carrier protein [Gemmatimonadales bacterium]|nr:acyl carrier protein [Gemmatimonadales bacterium]MYG49507.1 acyl carrier protein [Gemmatimonadales bacterium]MYK01703.1 acyl carrier protein [Candidatus Palauibacter ramosifaciens]